MTSLGFIIVGTSPPTHTHTPHPPLLKEGASREGVQNFMLERGDKPVKGGGGVDVEMGRLTLFCYFTVQSYLLCVRGK